MSTKISNGISYILCRITILQVYTDMNGIPLETLVPNKGHYYDSNPSLSELSPAVAALPAPPAIFSEAYRQIKAEST